MQPVSPQLTLPVGGAGTLYLWAQPQTVNRDTPYSSQTNPFRQLIAISMQLVTSGEAAEASGATLDNPIGPRFGDIVDSAPGNQVSVFDQTGASITYPQTSQGGLFGVSAYTIGVTPTSSWGIGPTCGAGVCFASGVGPAWRLGAFSFNALAQGQTEFRLQIGSSGMVHAGEQPNSPQTRVLFGSDTGVSYSAALDQQISLPGDQPDALIKVVAGLTGDFNYSGAVDAADYTVWRDGLGTAYTQSQYQVWRDSYGRTLSAAATSVPEPAGLSAALAGAGLLAGALSRRRGRRAVHLAVVATAIALTTSTGRSYAETFGVASNGVWSEPGTWTPAGGPPGATDVANVGRGFPDGAITPAIVSLTSNQSIDNLWIGDGTVDVGAFTLSAATVTVNGPANVLRSGGGIRTNALIVYPGGAYTVAGLDNVSRTIEISEGTTVAVNSPLNLSSRFLAANGSTLTINQPLSAGAMSRLYDGSTLDAYADLNFSTYSQNLARSGIDLERGSVLNLHGRTLTADDLNLLSQGNAVGPQVAFNRQGGNVVVGTVSVYGNNTFSISALDNVTEGLRVQGVGSFLSVDRPLTLSSSVAVNGGGTLDLKGDLVTSTTVTLDGSGIGTINLNGNRLTAEGGLIFNPAGSMVFNKQGGSFRTTSITVGGNGVVSVDPGDEITGSLSVSGRGAVTLNQSLTLGGEFARFKLGNFVGDNNGVVTLNGSGVTGFEAILNGGTIVTNGSATIQTDNTAWIGTQMSGTGVLTLAGTTTVFGSAKSVSGMLRNTGAMTWYAQPILLQQSGSVNTQFENAGTIVLEGVGTAFGVGSGAPTFVNQSTGTIRRNAAGTAAINVPVSNRGSIVANGGTIAFGAGLTNAASGRIGGDGTMATNLVNPGLVAPGNSPGILTIQGNYTQTASGILEIEVGGLTPGVGHDRLDVIPDANPGSGVATLAGRLTVPLINGFAPAVNDEITFLNASSIVGEFNAIFMPNPSGRAIELIQTPTSQRIRFVNQTVATQSATLAGTNEWSNTNTWATPVPDTTDAINLTNNTGLSIRVEVSADDAFVHQLSIAGGAATTTVSVENGKYLSATAGVQVAAAGIVELNNGTLSSALVLVNAGGSLTGNGTLLGDLTLGAAAGGPQAVVDPGLGGVGSFTLEGSYSQGAGGVLALDITGASTPGQFDTLTVQRDVALAGRLEIDVSGLSNAEFTPGEAYPIAVVGGDVTGAFGLVEVTGRSDLYFVVDYGATPSSVSEGIAAAVQSTAITLSGYFRGDGTRDGLIDDKDAMVFAAVLVNPQVGGVPCGEGCLAVTDFLSAFDFVDTTPDDSQTVDFFDIPYFAEALAASQAISLGEAYSRLTSAIEVAQAAAATPEPGATALLWAGAVSLGCFAKRTRD